MATFPRRFAVADFAFLWLDRWEHAYYIDYVRSSMGLRRRGGSNSRKPMALDLLQKNVKATYLDNIWSVINWKKAEERLTSA